MQTGDLYRQEMVDCGKGETGRSCSVQTARTGTDIAGRTAECTSATLAGPYWSRRRRLPIRNARRGPGVNKARALRAPLAARSTTCAAAINSRPLWLSLCAARQAFSEVASREACRG
jgi:hypothetical protein